jgi:hypothetical protein
MTLALPMCSDWSVVLGSGCACSLAKVVDGKSVHRQTIAQSRELMKPLISILFPAYNR